ncbi:Zinc finger protein [Armadillidium vulgare]|nr:Zinc finger protein [Armadillidium vulgare]
MDSYRRSGTTQITCTYWRSSDCFKGDRCSFLHGFICRDDGICSDPSCDRKHFKQRDPSTYMKRQGSRQRYRSRSRSPYSKRGPHSPYSRRRSPRRRSRTPRRVYSPRRSRSRKEIDKKGLSIDKLKLIMDAEKNLDEALGNRNSHDKMMSDNAKIVELESEDKSEAFEMFEKSKPKVSPFQNSSTSSISPSLKSLEMLKNMPKVFSQSPTEAKSDIKEKNKELYVQKLTEDDLFNEAFCKALNKGRDSEPGEKINECNQSSVLPPVLKHPLNAESLAKPFQEKLYGYEQQSNSSSSLWTPALDRSKNHNSSKPSQPVSNWEIDTPYVGRHSKKSASPIPVTRKSKKLQRSRSRSRSRSHERKKSPSVEKKGSKKTDKKTKKEKSPFESQVKIKKKKETKKIVIPAKVKIESEPEGQIEYAPSAAMKPHIKYIDQGMHWCKLCNEFLDNVKDYISHIESGNHLENLKDDPKTWLAVVPKIEKEPVDVNAPVISIPLQGMEFIHSFPAFYCSLCDSIIKTREEAQDHSETKLHVSKYKDHLSRNPLYEAAYVREKMAAFAKYSVDKERRKEKNPSLEHMKKQDFFGEVKNKTDEDIGQDEEEYLLEGSSYNPTVDESSSDKTNYTSAVTINTSSIRVASRGSISASTSIEEPVEKEESKANTKVDITVSNEIEPLKVVENSHSDKSEKVRVQTKKNELEDDIKRSLSEEEERKLQVLKKRVAEYKENPPTNEVKPMLKTDTGIENKTKNQIIKKDKESSLSPKSKRSSDSNQSSRLQIKKYSNVIIGKMPFLKKPKGSSSVSKSNPDHKTEEKDSLTEAEQRISKMFESFKSTFAESQNSGVLPPTVPRNTEYITEIESCESGTTFIKKFGPTLNPQGYSDNDDSQEMHMEISHDEHYSQEKNSVNEICHSLMDIPVPVDPKENVRNNLVPPVESKLKVDMNNPHLSQLSAAAAMYKEAVSSYQSISIPPPPYIQMPAVPPMMYPYNPQSATGIAEDYMDEYNSYNPQPPVIPEEYIDGINSSYNPLPPTRAPGEYIEGLNPPPPGTEEGSSNSNPASEGVDSPDSFLCQKTPPPPGTEDETPTLSRASTSSQQVPSTENRPNGQDYFKDILSDLPVLSYDSCPTGGPPSTKDETSQQSLVQEGLELLEFADEDEKNSNEKVIRNESPPSSLSY